MKLVPKVLIWTLLLVIAGAASTTWQNIQIEIDYDNLPVDPDYLPLLELEVNLAILYIQSLI